MEADIPGTAGQPPDALCEAFDEASFEVPSGGGELAVRAEIEALRRQLAAESRAAREDLIRHVSVQFHLLRADLRMIAERVSALSARLDHSGR